MSFKPAKVYIGYYVAQHELHIGVCSVNNLISKRARVHMGVNIPDFLAFKITIHALYRFLSEHSEPHILAEPFSYGHERLYKKLSMKCLEQSPEMIGNRLEILRALENRYAHIVNDINLYREYYLVVAEEEDY